MENVNTIDERRSKIVRNRVFDCRVSPDWRHMAIKNTVFSEFDRRSSIDKSVFDCRLPNVIGFWIQFFSYFVTTTQLSIERYIQMKHLKISCQMHKIGSLLLASTCMTKNMKTRSFLISLKKNETAGCFTVIVF